LLYPYEIQEAARSLPTLSAIAGAEDMEHTWLADEIGAAITQIHQAIGDGRHSVSSGNLAVPVDRTRAGVERVEEGGVVIVAGAGEQCVEGRDIERALIHARTERPRARDRRVPEEHPVVGTERLDLVGLGGSSAAAIAAKSEIHHAVAHRRYRAGAGQ